MKCFLPSMVAAVLATFAAAELTMAQFRSRPTFPQGDQRRSMGNHRPEPAQPAPNPPYSRPGQSGGGVLNHRPYSYGNPPYYRRPPVTPYYLMPSYGGTFYGGYSYGGYPYGGYWVHPYRIGPGPQLIHPYNYQYVPSPYFRYW